MGHLLPAAGRTKRDYKDVFRFNTVVRVPIGASGCEAFDCENIPPYLYDYKWTDFTKENEDCKKVQEFNLQRQKSKQDRRAQASKSEDMSHLATAGSTAGYFIDGSQCLELRQRLNNPVPGTHDAFEHTRGCGCGCGGTPKNTSCNNKTNYSNNNNKDAEETRCCNCVPAKKTRKPKAIPVSDLDLDWCLPYVDYGSYPPCPIPPPQCVDPELLAGTGWGYCPPCGDYRDLVRPWNKKLPTSTTRQGYFTHSSRLEEVVIPKAIKGGFDYCDWLDTQADREPPEDMRDMCVPSLCTWCAPEYVDCCPHYRNPHAYTMTRKPLTL